MQHEASPEVAGVFDRAHRLTTAGLLMLVSFVAFEAMAVTTAMPTAVRELDGLSWYAWPFTAFLVAQVVGMVVGGDIGDRRGARIALLWGVAAFAAGLLACGLATSMPALIGGRVLQGAGGGLISVSLYVVAGQAYAPELRARLFGTFAAGWALPAMFGPLVAGLVTTHASWRWVFLGLLPLIAVGLLLVLPAVRLLEVPEHRGPPAWARRGWSLLAGVAVGLLQYAGQRLDVLGIVIGGLGIAALVAALRHLLPRGTARFRRGLPTVIGVRGLLTGAFVGVDTLLPLALSQVHGFGAVAAGLPLTAGGVGWTLASTLQGRWPDTSRVRLLRAGFVLLTVGLAGTSLAVLPGLGGWSAYGTWIIAGLGMGLAMPSVGVLLLELSPEHRRGADSAAMQVSDVVGSALCVGLAGVLVAASESGLLSLTAALLISIGVFTAIAGLGVLVAGRVRAPAVFPASPDRPGAATTLAQS